MRTLYIIIKRLAWLVIRNEIKQTCSTSSSLSGDSIAAFNKLSKCGIVLWINSMIEQVSCLDSLQQKKFKDICHRLITACKWPSSRWFQGNAE